MSVIASQSRPNVFEIDLDAIAWNVAEIRRFVGPNVRIFVAMKANAYGFGIVEVGRVLEGSGVDVMCVSDVADAARLRDAGIMTPILLYAGSHIDARFVGGVEELGLWVTITDLEAADAYAKLVHSEITCFVKVDVGLERLGIPVGAASSALRRISHMSRLRVGGVYTHLHVPDETAPNGYVHWQLERFGSLVREARAAGVPIPIAMAASTPIVPNAGAAGFDAVDVGRLVYGSLRAGWDCGGRLRIRSAFSGLRSRLIQCKPIDRTEHVLEAPFGIRPGMRMGIAPMGYADGLESLNCGVALVHERRVPVLASSSLEHTRLDLTEVPDARVGDEVVFIGRQGAAEITPQEVLTHLDLRQPARMATAVRESVVRRYLRTAT
jgi:alanine racemase